MNRKNTELNFLNFITVILLLIVTICGIGSFDTTHSYEIINQYGDSVEIWGTGIYTHDSFFKAPIFIGSDFTMLIFIIPFAIISFIKVQKRQDVECYICNFGISSLLLYYSASLAFGVTYNTLHLIYIALFGVSFYSVGLLFSKLHTLSIQSDKVCEYSITKGMKIFLIIAGVSLFVAWLPDIITSLMKGTSLELIEVYTTEITYVFDMGIISPLIFLTIHLLKREGFIGYVFLRMILKVCIGVGIMLPMQTVFQLLSGILIPIPAVITKVMIFVLLAAFATLFEYRLKRETHYIKNGI